MPRGDTSDPGPGQRSGSRRKTVLGSSDFAFVEPFVEGVASINYDLLNDMLSSMTEYQCSLMFVMLGVFIDYKLNFGFVVGVSVFHEQNGTCPRFTELVHRWVCDAETDELQRALADLKRRHAHREADAIFDSIPAPQQQQPVVVVGGGGSGAAAAINATTADAAADNASAAAAAASSSSAAAVVRRPASLSRRLLPPPLQPRPVEPRTAAVGPGVASGLPSPNPSRVAGPFSRGGGGDVSSSYTSQSNTGRAPGGYNVLPPVLTPSFVLPLAVTQPVGNSGVQPQGPAQQQHSPAAPPPQIFDPAGGGNGRGAVTKEAVRQLLEGRTRQFQRIVRDAAHFGQALAAYESLSEQEPAPGTVFGEDGSGRAVRDPCADFPEDDAEAQCALVGQLFEAVHDCRTTIEDGARSVAIGRLAKYADFEVELFCWEVLLAARDAQKGQIGMRLYSKDFKYEPYKTFRDRWHELLNSVRLSKANVHQALRSSFMRRLAAAPQGEYKRKLSNREVNDTRNDQVAISVAAVQDRLVTISDGAISLATGTVVRPTRMHSATFNHERGKIERRDTKSARRKAMGIVVEHQAHRVAGASAAEDDDAASSSSAGPSTDEGGLASKVAAGAAGSSSVRGQRNKPRQQRGGGGAATTRRNGVVKRRLTRKNVNEAAVLAVAATTTAVAATPAPPVGNDNNNAAAAPAVAVVVPLTPSKSAASGGGAAATTPLLTGGDVDDASGGIGAANPDQQQALWNAYLAGNGGMLAPAGDGAMQSVVLDGAMQGVVLEASVPVPAANGDGDNGGGDDGAYELFVDPALSNANFDFHMALGHSFVPQPEPQPHDYQLPARKQEQDHQTPFVHQNGAGGGVDSAPLTDAQWLAVLDLAGEGLDVGDLDGSFSTGETFFDDAMEG